MILKGKNKTKKKGNSYGFKMKKYPQQHPDSVPYQEDIFSLSQNLLNKFQRRIATGYKNKNRFKKKSGNQKWFTKTDKISFLLNTNN